MKGLREIKNRIKVINNTSKITRAMQLVAASKMRRAQQLALNSRPYLLMLSEIAASISALKELKINHPFFDVRNVKHRGILLIGTEKGLCGALNQNLFKTISHEEGALKFVTIGKRATQFVVRTRHKLLAQFSIGDKIMFHDLRVVVEFLKQAYLDGEIDTVEVVFPRFVNTLIQEPVIQRVLPMINFEDELEAIRKRMKISSDEILSDPRDMLVEPDIDAILEQLTPLFLTQNIYKLVLEAKAAEHSARMIAMKNATDNAESLAKSLNVEYNRARQAAITNEIIEISAAAQGEF